MWAPHLPWRLLHRILLARMACMRTSSPMLRTGTRLAPLAAALILGAAPSRLLAQSPADRAELERFRDSLAGTVDSMGLLALERQTIEQAKVDRNNTPIHLKLGFLSLRLGEL